MRAFALALLSLLVVACAPPLATDGVVCIDAHMSEAQIAASVEGVELWNVHEGFALRAVVTADECEVDIRTGEPGPGATATAFDERRIRVAWHRMVPSQWAPVIAHELGHAMGAGHSNNRANLMHHVLQDQTCATAADAQAVRDAQ